MTKEDDVLNEKFGTLCDLCGHVLNVNDPKVWKQVSGWVHGPKAHGLTLREYTGLFAHDACVNKGRAKQAPDQESLLDEPEMISIKPADLTLAEELFNEKN